MEILFCASLFFLFETLECGTFTQTKTVYDDMFQNYTKEIRPVLDQSDPVVTNVSMTLSVINDFDEVRGVIKISAGFFLLWKDANLVWDSTSTNVSSLIVSQEMIWLPRLFINNPADTAEPIDNKYFKAAINNDGTIIWTPGSLLSATCSPDVTKYPYDSQACAVRVYAYGYSSKQVSLNCFSDTINMDSFTENSEWSIDNTKAFCEHIPTASGGLSVATFDLQINRRSLYMEINVIVPIILLVMITPFVFLLPGNSGERASYSITVLLSFSVYMTVVSEKMPASSLPMSYISYFLLICLVISMIVVTINVLQMRLYDKGDDQPIPYWLIRIFRRIHRKKANNRVANVKKSDMNSNNQSKEPYTHNDQKLVNSEKQTKTIDIAMELKERNESRTQFTSNTNIELTWRLVASTLDKLYFFIFFIGGIIFSFLFMLIIKRL